MPRPGFTLEVDDRTPPMVVVQGASVRLQRFGLGTQVVYPPDPTELSDPAPLVAAALERADLAARLRPETRLTVVVGDTTSPRPGMTQDVRQTIVEQVLELAAAARVYDVVILVATGLRRHLRAADLTALLGERVVRSFLARGDVRNHDVTADDLVDIGTVDGLRVHVNPQLTSSDVIVNVSVRTGLASDAGDQLALGLTGVETIDHLNGLHGSAERRRAASELIQRQADVVAIEAVLGQPSYPPPLGFLSRREWDWTARDRAAVIGVRQALSSIPKQATQRVFGHLRADYAVTAVEAGAQDQVTAATRDLWLQAHAVDAPGDADVLVTSVWGRGSDPTAPAGDPLAAAHNAIVTQTRAVVGGSLAREGGVLIAFHPMRPTFSTRHHSAAADFFSDVLSLTRDPDEIAARFQESFVTDPWYLELYRNRDAFHPLHTFHRWYQTARAAGRFADVIWVGADRRTAKRLGFRAASTYEDALEIASDTVGDQAKVTVLHTTGHLLGRVS